MRGQRARAGGVFVVLALTGGLLLVSTVRWLPETLPVQRRNTGRWRTSMVVFARLLADRQFTGYALAGGLGFAAMFAYIAGSPFVVQSAIGGIGIVVSVLTGVGLAGSHTAVPMAVTIAVAGVAGLTATALTRTPRRVSV